MSEYIPPTVQQVVLEALVRIERIEQALEIEPISDEVLEVRKQQIHERLMGRERKEPKQ